MREHLQARFGQPGVTLWLTERVWDPSLPADLAEAGVECVLVDDRHLHLAGLGRDAIHRPWRTEYRGRGVWLLAIDERLRYVVPFQAPEAFSEQVRAYRAAGHRMVVLADDGEKFGGWPGTRRWVWEEGWMSRFADQLDRLRAGGELRLVRARELAHTVESGGLVYLPTASYREMEGWTLPAEAEGHRFAAEARLSDAPYEERVWVRGGEWRGFLARYPESNRMHKKAAVLSRLSRASGDPPAAREALGRAQCNDAYWHGVFGGLYVRPLREAIWRNLAAAESVLREGEALAVETIDLDADGRDEIWIHSSRFSAVVAPHRGGALEELTVFAHGRNLLDVLTRRREAYHRTGPGGEGEHAPGNDSGSGVASSDGNQTGDAHRDDDGGARGDPGMEGGSIHDLEARLSLEALPPVDAVERTAFVEAALLEGASGFPATVDPHGLAADWWRASFEAHIAGGPDIVEITLVGGLPGVKLRKRYRFHEDGRVEVHLEWDTGALAPGTRVLGAVSMAWHAPLRVAPEPEDDRFETIRTVSRTEQGWAQEEQGFTRIFAWPAGAGHAELELDPREPT
jgi:hypothetical protein